MYLKILALQHRAHLTMNVTYRTFARTANVLIHANYELLVESMHIVK
jgi:hypothetical protein